ncbi:diacylglycerol lipase-alpha-like isoform X2 [Ornithodoros turicata]|uniref:diacylglycerol lipase-alpha-like isoform X2 n=1 Tax=Ornithodoros turicata TaxID=34597 RepID=UPI003138AD0B
MPGIVVFKRRWSVGSDDFVVPGIFLLILHTIWLVVLSVLLGALDFSVASCLEELQEHLLGYVILLSGCVLVEAAICCVSMRGSILDTQPRAPMQYLLYVRLGILLVEVSWLVVGVVWVSKYYHDCPMGAAREAVLGIIVCNWCVLLSVLVTVWCTFDAAGRTWVKMKRYQRSLRDAKLRYRRSGSSHRNWRHRKAVREYQDSWNKRCRLLFCCMGTNDRNRNSFTEIAKLLSDFFRDLDVVPSDVVAGLVLLRRCQRQDRLRIAAQKNNDTYQFLSGVAVTPNTQFLDIHHPPARQEVQDLAHYMQYALGVYGWPMFMMTHGGTACCQLLPGLRCCCLGAKKHRERALVLDDNCCGCNYAALRRMVKHPNTDVVYATYHVDVGETPFFVAVDHEKRTVVVSVRGTLSLQDVLTDLNAEGEQLPTNPVHEDWIGHKGMVQAAEYIRRKLLEEGILGQAFNFSIEKGTTQYELVLVGHSLGAGAAAILAILLRQDFPNLVCYAFAPPGGLLSLPAVEYSKAFITSVVLGKDVVPRIGLHQMEALRTDLISAIKRSKDPKWKIILGGVLCCCPAASEDGEGGGSINGGCQQHAERDVTSHPSDATIALTAHQPLYPPGRILHIVRNHPTNQKYEPTWRRVVRKQDPVYQALWADNRDFDQVLISPVMIQDHMPDKLLDSLCKLLVQTGPTKPQRGGSIANSLGPSDTPLSSGGPPNSSPPDAVERRGVVLETSFTDLLPQDDPDALHGSMQDLLVHQVRQFRLAPPSHRHAGGAYGSLSSRQSSFDAQPVLGNHRWAPLASPETLSEVSSVSSAGGVNNIQKRYPQPLSSGLGSPEDVLEEEGPILVTRATVESCPMFHPDLLLIAPSSVVHEQQDDALRIAVGEALREELCGGGMHSEGCDSTYASSSTTVERLASPRVETYCANTTGEQCSSTDHYCFAASAESGDSLYASGDSLLASSSPRLDPPPRRPPPTESSL